MLPPGQRGPGRVLDPGHLRSAASFVFGQRRVHRVAGRAGPGRLFIERRDQCDSVFHRHFGAGADGEVGGVRGVAEQGHSGPAGPVALIHGDFASRVAALG